MNSDALRVAGQPVEEPVEEPELCEGPLAAQPVILDNDLIQGDVVKSWRADAVEGSALHVVEISQANFPQDTASVAWELPGENVLALVAIQSVNWNIDVAPGAGLQKVIVFGYHPPTVTAPPGVELEMHYWTDAKDPLAGLLWTEGNENYVEYAGMLAEQLTGVKLVGSDECHQASQFRFSGCDVDPGPEMCGPLPAQPVILNHDPDTGDKITSWRADPVEGPALHVAGIFQATYPQDTASVAWELPGENVLALVAVQSVNWKIDVAPGAGLQKVIVFGWYAQTVIAPPGVEIEMHIWEDTEDPLPLQIWTAGEENHFKVAGETAEQLTGLKLVSFDGVSQASQFCFSGCSSCDGQVDPVDPGGEQCEDRLAPVPVILDGKGEVDSFRADAVAPGPVLHVASVYQTHPDHGDVHPMGQADVLWELPGENVLGLTSYEPVTWNIHVSDGAALQKIVVFGYHEQVVEAPPGVEIEIYAYEGQSLGFPPEVCAFEYPDQSDDGCDTNAMFAGFESVTGLPVSSFDGCYDASTFYFATTCGS